MNSAYGSGGEHVPAKPMWGKYRAKVVQNIDPLFLGRVQVELAISPATPMNWCMPCTPYAGMQEGFYAIPPIGANVWVEFEGGDINMPIWAGCFWGEGETPIAAGPPNPLIKTFKTEWMTLTLNDTPGIGGFSLTCLPPAVPVPLTMTFNELGVTIFAPPASVKMSPEGGVTLTFPPGMVSLSPAGVTTTAGPSTTLVSPAAVTTNAPAVETTAEGAVSVTAGAGATMESEGAISLQAGLSASITAAGTASVTAAEVLSLTGSLVVLN